MAEALQKKEDKSTDSSGAAKKKLDVMGLLLTILFALNAGALGYFGFTLKSLFQKVKVLESKQDSKVEKAGEEAEKTKLGRDFEPKNLGPMFRMDSFLVNIQSEQGTKFLQLQMELELKDEATKEEVLKNQAKLRDSVITLLSSRPYQQVRTAQGMKSLRKDLLSLFNQSLSQGSIKDIFFTQFHFN